MKKILIADDIPTNRILLRQTLGSLGDYEIVEAVDGQDAIDLYSKEKPDLILMDVMMPEIDGYEATAVIKNLMANDYVPIIFLTALSSEESLSAALESGGDDFISKPFNIEILESKIHAHLRIRELTQELNKNNILLTDANKNLVYEQNLIEHFFESAINQNFLDEEIIKYHMSSLSSFNGDIFLSEKGPDGSLYAIVGDFTGHGLTAAMGTLPAAMVFFATVKSGLSVGEIATELNDQLFKLMPHGMFLTASILQINTYEGVLSIWSGGMPETYVFNKNNELKNIIESQHMPLGILEHDEFDSLTQVIKIADLDKVYLYSDGIIEAHSPEKELFGEERLKNALIDGGEDRFNHLLNNLHTFTGEENQKDDITLLEINCVTIPVPKIRGKRHKESNLEWEISISVSDEDMKMSNPISRLFDIFSALPFISQNKDVLHVLILEIYNNALDHSILNLESINKSDPEKFSEYYISRDKKIQSLENTFIKFNFNFISSDDSCYLEINVTDSGSGYQKNSKTSTSDDSHGRGLDIINSFCEKTSFSDDGKVFTALYRL